MTTGRINQVAIVSSGAQGRRPTTTGRSSRLVTHIAGDRAVVSCAKQRPVPHASSFPGYQPADWPANRRIFGSLPSRRVRRSEFETVAIEKSLQPPTRYRSQRDRLQFRTFPLTNGGKLPPPPRRPGETSY